MFISSEAALSAAATRDPPLLADAAARQVMIATPTSMAALLQVVALGWREEAMSRNAEQIREVASELARRLMTFGEHLGGVGRGLDTAARAYNSAVGSFEQRVMPQLRRAADLGVGEARCARAPEPTDVVVRAMATSTQPADERMLTDELAGMPGEPSIKSPKG